MKLSTVVLYAGAGTAVVFALATACHPESLGQEASAASSDDGVGSGPVTPVCDVLVVGGGTGGVAAAHEAASLGVHTCLFEETDWVGGQFTNQAVPYDGLSQGNDSKTLTDYLEAVRAEYRRTYSAWADAGRTNPGECTRPICFEPNVGEVVLVRDILGPLEASGWLNVMTQYRPISVTAKGTAVNGVWFRSVATGATWYVPAKIVIDATEYADLFPEVMDEGPGANVGYRLGRDGPLTYFPRERDAQFQWDGANTPWPDPSDAGDDECVQRLNWVFALQYANREFDDDAGGIPPPPPNYDPANYSSVDVAAIWSQADVPGSGSLWTFRRAFAGRKLRGNFSTTPAPDASLGAADPAYDDVTLINFFGAANDFGAVSQARCNPGAGPPYHCNPAKFTYVDRQPILANARNHAIGYFHYMRHDDPRGDGGFGFRNVRTRPSLQGLDFVARTPYLRETKRLKGLTTVTEEDLLVNLAQTPAGANPVGRRYDDTLGSELYFLDLKGCAPSEKTPAGEQAPPDSLKNIPGPRAQIPLGALIPETVDGFLAGGKNLSVSHIASAEYRVHVFEWSIGQAAGATAAMALLLQPGNVVQPRTIRSTEPYLRRLQQVLVNGRGGKLVFADDVSSADRTSPVYQSVMMLGGARVMEADLDAGFRPNQGLTRGEGADLVAKELSFPPADGGTSSFTDVPPGSPYYGSIQALADRGLVGGYLDGTFRPGNSMTRSQLAKVLVSADCFVNPGACPSPVPDAGYTDVSPTDWFYSYVAWGRARGLFAGEVSGPIFDAGSVITRGSAAQWGYNHLKLKDGLP